MRCDELLWRERAGLLNGAVVGGAFVHAALERSRVGERGDERVDQMDRVRLLKTVCHRRGPREMPCPGSFASTCQNLVL